MEFEIAKKNHLASYIYAIIGGVILILGYILLINTTGVNASFDTPEVFLLFTIVLLLVITFKIIPNIPLKKHIKIGLIHFCPESIMIEDVSGNKNINLNDPNLIKIRLCGYDGQHRLGDIDYLGKGNASIYPDIRPVDGLKNNILVETNEKKIKYEFYIPNKDYFEQLKELFIKWSSMYKNVQIKTVR